MNNIRLFFKESLSNNLTGKLNKDQSHYLLKVMRIKKGDNFNLFNENGEWVAHFESIKSGLINFKLGNQLRSKEHQNELWLAFSPIKSNFFNFMIQKSTELGVTNFIPIIFDRTIVRKINLDRLRKIVVEASEQSNRINIPSIEEPTTLKKFDLIGEKASHNSFLCSFDLICFPSLKFINPDLILSKLSLIHI